MRGMDEALRAATPKLAAQIDLVREAARHGDASAALGTALRTAYCRGWMDALDGVIDAYVTAEAEGAANTVPTEWTGDDRT